MVNATSALLAQAETGREPGAPAVGPDASRHLAVNGAARALAVEPRATLAEVLRGPLRPHRDQDRLQSRRLFGAARFGSTARQSALA